jgi:2-polyprenyl-3-methyl-5-hydroxy-6-metoxy-1,4-benzoquinol methylase
LIRLIRTLLTARGVHFLVTRFGPARLRRVAFDEKYRRGAWRFDGDSSVELSAAVLRYLGQGDLLMLGCGGASVLRNIDDSAVSSVLGVDLSSEAIRVAERYANDKIRFEIGDMETFECRHRYDAILFSESLYYVPAKRHLPTLFRLALKLKPGGVFVVTLAEPGRYQHIIDTVRKHFRVLEDRRFTGSERHLLVFLPRDSHVA